MFADTEGVSRSRKSTKNRQHNDLKKEENTTTIGRHSITQKTKKMSCTHTIKRRCKLFLPTSVIRHVNVPRHEHRVFCKSHWTQLYVIECK